MKTPFLILGIIMMTLTSCIVSDDDSSENTAPNTGVITGEITTNTTYGKGNYILSGTVRVKSGATLTIGTGSTITADKVDGVDAIVVEQGGKLIANGTADEPIVFTEKSKTLGSWGGIILYGNAPILRRGPITEATSEDGFSIKYGGTVADDNSGSLKFVRVEYAGRKISDGTSEMNGFSFYAVGSGTTLENLVSYMGADDGFEFYGGTVSASNLISYGNTDDSFDWQDSWKGQNNKNWFAYQTGQANYGMEIEASSSVNTFYPTIDNITLVRADGTVPETAGSVEYDAIQFKKEGNGVFTNLKIKGYTTSGAVAVRIQDTGTNTNQVNTGYIKLLNINIIGGTTPYKGAGSIVVNFPAANFTISSTATGATLTPGAWATVDGINLLANL